MNATLTPAPSRPYLNGNTRPPLEPGPATGSPGQRLLDWIRQIESLPDPAARELFLNCLQSVMALHRDGLARIFQLIKNAGAAGGEVSSALVADRLVQSLLLIHDLHPVPLETRLRGALDKVRPYMKSHGGDVELVSMKDHTARLRLVGACKSCPSSSVTMEFAVRQAIEEACPDLAGYELDSVTATAAR